LAIRVLVTEFSIFFGEGEESSLQSIQFMSQEMCTVNMFEVEIRKHAKQSETQPKLVDLKQEIVKN
jgi:hypothetical protein